WIANRGWHEVNVDLSSFRGLGLRFRWRLGSGQTAFGQPDGWWVDDVEVSYAAFVPCSATWSVAPSHPLGALLPATAGLDGAFFAFGGRREFVGDPIANAYRYDPMSAAWTPIAPLPEPRVGASAVTDGRHIYIL